MDMGPSKESKVFILGAGCSADCGYPLGKGLAAQLEEFHSEISGRFPIIERCVWDTINLANGLPQFDTLDQLAKHAEETFSSWRQRKGGIVWDKDSQEQQNLCDKQIMDAKIAVSAMFLAREERARSKGLPSYERFIASIFGGEPWEEGVKAASCHVLTFNYDRLFEIAFLDYFKSFDPNRTSLYGRCVLNSGFNQGANGGLDKIEPVAGQFSFLKLHGSAGWWVWESLEERERRRYWPAVPTGPTNMHDIEALLQKNGVYSNDTLRRLRALPWEPLITFPHEKQRSLESRRTGFPYDPYIRQVWDHAAQLLAATTEVEVIGYSFSAIDSRHMVNELLLRATHAKKIIVRNLDVATVEAKLRSYAQLRGRVEFLRSRFGEYSCAP